MNFLKPLSNQHFIEHHHWHYNNETIAKEQLSEPPAPILFLKRNKAVCFHIDPTTRVATTGYYVGVDWVIEKEKAVYVQPKLNKDSTEQTDYLKMLFSALTHPEVTQYTDSLFEIKWDATPIEIEQQQDLLTPLLVLQFLRVVEHIVRKGLKKSYYKVESNLYGKIKGKILVGQTIKQNLLKNKQLHTICNYDEFGYNGLENRLLKKALTFVKRYLPTLRNLNTSAYTENVFNYINPAFEFVSEEVSLHEVQGTKTNIFYKEYAEAIRLAKLILKRFGYNLSNIENKQKIKTPPFWIDMAKLFELYVFAQLKTEYGNEIQFQVAGKETYLDFLLTKPNKQTIIDAKYKLRYDYTYDIDDIRQLSGYARDREVMHTLGFKNIAEENWPIIPCLIIYPNQNSSDILSKNEEKPIVYFVKFNKQCLKIPTIKF